QLSQDLNQSTVEEQQPRPSSPPPPQPQHEQPQQQQQQLQEPQPTTPHPQKVGGDTEELARLLRSLGITPEVLLASSGLLDRGTLLTLLHTSSGQRLSAGPQYDYPGDYITNRIITPTKYRGPPSRECGTQCDDPPPDRSSPRRESRRRGSRRNTASLPRDSGHSSDARPPWGHNHSDRPYRKQSEKDPYSSRRLRRRAARSLSRCERDTGTEESDQPQPQRRRRKTWDKSRQESLSSDISRSPSPRDRRRSSRTSATSRQWPTIKPSLTPALHYPYTPEPAPKPPPSPPLPTHKSMQGEEEPDDDDDDVQVVTTPTVYTPAPARSSSPPVPALMRKLTGESTFDVPEFAPDTSVPAPRTNSPPIPTVLKRLQSADSTPMLPELPNPPSRPLSRPPSPRSLSAANCLGSGSRPGSRPGSSGSQPALQGRIVADLSLDGRSSSQPPSPCSRPPTPRRLPPMTPSRSEELVTSPRSASELRSTSPPVPALAKRLSATSRPGQPPQATCLERQLTPVETPESPRAPSASSPTASPPSAVTSGMYPKDVGGELHCG
ncbi:proline-rich protein 36-like, partial [Homarus americanus]|uniref:proline-rich protein 36-like n=1 Tax=Homarus americanus TaxID=6706 RepID=UPI001C451796